MLTGKNIIGSSESAKGKNIFFGINPNDGNKLEPGFYEASEEEINAAIEKATAAFQDYRNKSGVEKAGFLESIENEIMNLGDVLIQRCMEETGLPDARLKGERARTINQLKLFASYLKEGSWVDARIDTSDLTRTPPKPDLRSMEKALGPVGIFGASNFPLAFSVAGGDTVSALAAGCTVVFKGHPAHPGTSEYIAQAILKAIEKTGMPKGVFSFLHGKSNEVGMSIVKHPAIKAIGFTGSYRGGKALFDTAQTRPVPIPVYAEMGSTNPVFILPEASRERGEAIAKELSASVTLGTGQFCTNPGLVFIGNDADGKNFIDKFSKAIEVSPCGVMLTLSIQQNFVSGIKRLTGDPNIKLLSHGKDNLTGFNVSPHLFQTTAESFIKNHLLEEEVFGPVSLAVTFDQKEKLLNLARSLGGHLTATILGTEADLANNVDLIAILEQKVGRLIINGYPTGVEVAHAMVHGGPFPSTTDSRTTSVGTNAIRRFTRPVCYQNFPASLLPSELQEKNPLQIWRLVNGNRIKD